MTDKVKIKPIGGKDNEAVLVFPVDAKEAVTSGTHEYVGTNLGKADWLENKKGSKTAIKPAVQAETEGGEKSIDQMTSKELDAVIDEKELDVKKSLNLPKKREAVAAALAEGSDGDL